MSAITKFPRQIMLKKTCFLGWRSVIFLYLLFFFGAVSPLFSQSVQRHLFLDPSFIAESENANLHVNSPEKSEIVIRRDRPWEERMITFYTTVIEEEGIIRMWYICRDADNKPNVAYAESKDGVNWTKPDLGIVEYHGSTNNNLVGIPYLDGTVYKDPNASKSERYIYIAHVYGEGVFRFTSPDGLRWQRDEKALLPFRADTQNNVFWDSRINKYVLYLRGWNVEGEWSDRLRKVVRLELNSLDSPTGVQPSGKGDNPDKPDDLPRIVDEIPTVLAADEQDPSNMDVYTISAQPYPLDPQWYVAFPSMFLREAHISDGRLETHFVGSKDGIHWNRYDRSPFVTTGLADSENANMTFIGPGIIERGEKLWLYGTGYKFRHGDTEGPDKEGDGVIYRHVIRKDGLVSLNFISEGGLAKTKSVEVIGKTLYVNIDTEVLGTVCVGLEDAEGKAIPGFGSKDCNVLRTNDTKAKVSWKNHSDLSSLKGQQVRVVFSGKKGKVYSFFFE